MSKPADLDISPDVLYGIAQLAIEQLDGIRPIQPSVRVGEILTRRRAKGIAIERVGAEVSVALLRRRQTSKPSKSGSITSSTINAGWWFFAFSTACAPLSASANAR